jgi:uncharacterized membrane protein
MHRIIRATAAALALLAAAALAGCGSDQFDRTTTGAGTGAATGAVIGLIGGPRGGPIGVAAGAAIGAGAGAVTGAVTSPKDVNLGKPVWQDGTPPPS